MINGLTYISNFISETDQVSLISIIDNQQWLNDLKRRTQHYGYKYDYTKKRIDSSLYLGKLPDWISFLTDKMVSYFKEMPDQVIINEYLPGQGISKHIDCVPCFSETVASLSLLSTCAMEFESTKTFRKGSIILAPLSLLILSGESRYEWLHSIPARKEDLLDDIVMPRSRRVSLTFRKIINTSKDISGSVEGKL